jgi:hypothetical protein
MSTPVSLPALSALLGRLQATQRELIAEAASRAMLPSDGAIRRSSELENVIAAVEALIHDEAKDKSTRRL